MYAYAKTFICGIAHCRKVLHLAKRHSNTKVLRDCKKEDLVVENDLTVVVAVEMTIKLGL